MNRVFSLLMVFVLVVGTAISMSAPAMSDEAAASYYVLEFGDIDGVRLLILKFSRSDSIVRVRVSNIWFTGTVSRLQAIRKRRRPTQNR